MSTWTKEAIEQEIERLNKIQPFWHNIQLPYDLFTADRNNDERLNYNETKWRRIKDIISPKGKRVLDVGCNEGFFSIEMIKSGAREVHAIDINEHRIAKAGFVLDVLGVSGITLHKKNIYQIDELHLGTFDIVLALGILHRVPDPYTLLKVLTGLGKVIVLEWQCLIDERPVMEFWGGGYKTYDVDNSGYWKPSIACARSVLDRHGFCHHYCLDKYSSRAILISSAHELDNLEEFEKADSVNSSKKTPVEWMKSIIQKKLK